MMKLFTIVGDWLIKTAKKHPYSHIKGRDGGDYMRRWWLIPYNRLGISARVHEILQSDDARHYHDHPWWYISIILRGGYFENTPIYDESGLYQGARRKWKGPGSIVFRKAKSWHYLSLHDNKPAYTLFICGRKSQKWGFLFQPSYKVYYRELLRENATPAPDEHE